MAHTEMPGEIAIIGTPELADHPVETVDEQKFEEMFRMLAEINLAVHAAMKEHAEIARQQSKEKSHALEAEHPIAA